jgi:8-oxo-dGTP pyrophosphatase MutT (NUDIX family)
MSLSEVECLTLDGHNRIFPVDRLILRPAAYALIIHEGKLLLLKMRHTGKYHLPGGGIHIGERMEQTLKREVLEETGIEIDLVRFAHFEEVFFYYDPSDRAYHGLHFYFLCRPTTFKLLADDMLKDESAEQPRWKEILDLHPTEFQVHGDIILKLCERINL